MRVPLKELPEFAGNVLAAIWLDGAQESATIIALEGELGSGKTTFVQALCKRLKINETIQSPTYVLMKTYPLDGPVTSFGAPRRFNRLVHIDAYRLESPEQCMALKPQEFLDDPKALVLVEWPQKLGRFLPKPNVVLRFSSEGMDSDERDIVMEQKS